jgi:hypothetical protein
MRKGKRKGEGGEEEVVGWEMGGGGGGRGGKSLAGHFSLRAN